jgi:hypothetical protein
MKKSRDKKAAAHVTHRCEANHASLASHLNMNQNQFVPIPSTTHYVHPLQAETAPYRSPYQVSKMSTKSTVVPGGT